MQKEGFTLEDLNSEPRRWMKSTVYIPDNKVQEHKKSPKHLFEALSEPYWTFFEPIYR
jgi:hypothetical protein